MDADLKTYKVTWDELVDDCHRLSGLVSHYHFDRILCISRGGLVWARMLSDLLNLPVSHLTVTSYRDLKQQKETKITEMPMDIKNQTLLVVDEISDSGKTFKIVIDYLKSLKIEKFYTMTPIVRSFTLPRPDFYLKVIDDWIVFPYEIRETFDSFMKIYLNKKLVKEKLLKLGFDEKEIASLQQ